MPSKLVVAALLWNNKKQILLARRPATAKIAPNKYHLPGGHVEIDETPESALARELKEELGAEVIVRKPFFTATYNTDTGKSVVIFYEATLVRMMPEFATSSHELESWIWISPTDASKYLHEEDYNLEAVNIGSKKIKRFRSNPKRYSR